MWPYFHRIDILIGPTLFKSPPSLATASRVATFPLQFPQKTRTQIITNSVRINIKNRPRSPMTVTEEEGGGGWSLLARAVLGFGEIYERVERGKTMQAVEIEKQRMKFFKELDVQWMEFLVNAQMEISTLDRHLGERSHRRHRRSSSDVNCSTK